MDSWRPPTPSQLRRLVEELAEAGLDLDGSQRWHELAIEEIAYAIRPKVHERYVPSYGALVEPTTDPETWRSVTGLVIERGPLGIHPDVSTRRYSDGIASWLLRRTDGTNEWVTLDRPAGSERDVVVLATALGATVVQRHPTGVVRVVGDYGVYRWAGLGWRHEPLVTHWIDGLSTVDHEERHVLHRLLEFAVHDLGARGIGAILVYRADDSLTLSHELRLSPPPALRITWPMSLAPLRHALAQTDGAALFDDDGRARPARGPARPHHRGRGRRRRVQGHAPHVGPPLQLRRPGRHGDRGERGRSRHRLPGRRGGGHGRDHARRARRPQLTVAKHPRTGPAGRSPRPVSAVAS